MLNLGFASFENNAGAAEQMEDNKGRGQLLGATAVELEKELGAQVQVGTLPYWVGAARRPVARFVARLVTKEKTL